MDDLELKIGLSDYEHTRALADGTVKIDGADATFESSFLVSDIFERMVRNQDFDVAELGLTFYLRTLDLDDPPFVAIPVFPNRQFRHSAIFVNNSSGIENPEDLAGKTIGEFATYGHDAGFWAKGILSDGYGFTPDQSRWVIGGFDWPMAPFDFIPEIHPADVEVTRAPEGQALGPMLDAGEIDALISADVPQCVLNGSPRVRRLFPDYRAVERDYYQRTGIFPIMHTVVFRKELVAQHPDLARAVYQGFRQSKDLTLKQYRTGMIFNHGNRTIPWLNELVEEVHNVFPEDWWPYGIEANRETIDTFLRYHHEQGLSRTLLDAEDIFVPGLLDT